MGPSPCNCPHQKRSSCSRRRASVVGRTAGIPTFPVPAADETEPGTVFETREHGPLTWVVIGRGSGHSIKYGVVAPAIRAGTIEVTCADDGNGNTAATVTYDMTALTEDGDLWLAEFAAEYDAYLDHWSHAITTAISA